MSSVSIKASKVGGIAVVHCRFFILSVTLCVQNTEESALQLIQPPRQS